MSLSLTEYIKAYVTERHFIVTEHKLKKIEENCHLSYINVFKDNINLAALLNSRPGCPDFYKVLHLHITVVCAPEVSQTI